ncbi:MAG TPA: MFS transporter, partial [Gemmatimonadaceae bacterium]|nr:MFS transporter [Gemmatimonadaceae bacterium]
MTVSNRDAPSPWRPLRVPLFRNLLIADVLSDVGTFMQSVGAAWLMVSLGAGPMYVALTQTASALAFFLFALPAGALGDIVDRRRLILRTETWMVVIATVIAVVTIAHRMTPWLLLALTFALSAGDAVETPTWRAVLPELVGRDDLAAASALNGIEFNFARAVGPALAGLLIAATSVGIAFALNAISFFGVIAIILRWKRAPDRRTTPPETVAGATIAALRYVRYSPLMRRIMIRAGVTMFFASALLALLPSLAGMVSGTAAGYGVLLGCFGAGAVGGATVMQRARARYSADLVVAGGIAVLGSATIAAGLFRSMILLTFTMLVAGAAWIVFVSLLSALMQTLTPDWVRARVLAVYLLVFQAGLAAGSAVWGTIASRTNVHLALTVAGIGTIATLALRFLVRLPDTVVAVTPWNDRRMPTVIPDAEPAPDRGPVLVTIEYDVQRARTGDFLRLVEAYGQVRRRDGAYWWGVF